ncbi:MAG: hypothetical protein AAFY51_00260 [Pseudomonadota bacterium]
MGKNTPHTIRADVDDMKLAVIEHLTGARLQRRRSVSETMKNSTPILVSLGWMVSIYSVISNF